MRVFLAHPSALTYSHNYMKLEPLGLERVAQAVRTAGHEVRLLDLQVFRRERYVQSLLRWRPQAIGLSLNYLANVPEVIDLAIEAKRRLPKSFVFVGGHTATFIPNELLQHADGAIDCVVRGEGEITVQRLLEEAPGGRYEQVPGVVSPLGSGPAPALIPESDLNVYWPARDLLGRRRRYFLGELDPCASIEFSRGCPYDCSFCSAWTFYNQTYRKASPQAIVKELSRIPEPNVFLVDDMAFLDPRHAMEVAEEVQRRNIRKRYFMETRCDTLIRNEEAFIRWKKLGLTYLFLGFEAIDEEGLKGFRKKATMDDNLHALEIARKMEITVAVNIIASPQWDKDTFHRVEQWALSIPEIVHLTVMMPYPGTETWRTEGPHITTGDYRLFDTQHAVTSTKLPLAEFYEEFTRTQMVLFRRHLNKVNVYGAAKKVVHCLVRGQTNFAKATLNFKALPNPRRRYADHFMDVRYAIHAPAVPPAPPAFVHAHRETQRQATPSSAP